ncbi:hypothetical protein AX14_010988 [Amanita brunnescens Koide BX004]|nr:hypothetical protein AX14_010988 [Amanita brunnescens Koide BX004]
MHAYTTGPLQTGTYVLQAVDRPGEFETVKEDRSNFGSSRDYNRAAKWSFERVGDDVFRITVKDMNVTASYRPGQQTLSVAQGTADWIFRESNVPGQYYSSPAGYPSLRICAKVNGPEDVDLHVGTETTKLYFFRVDE